jgi:hypothetical protein
MQQHGCLTGRASAANGDVNIIDNGVLLVSSFM